MKENPIKVPNQSFSSAAPLATHKLAECAATPSMPISKEHSVASNTTTNRELTVKKVKPDLISKFDVALYREKAKGMDTSSL